MEFNLEGIFQIGLASDSYSMIMKTIKIYGQLSSADESISIQLLEVFPNIHSLIVQNVLVAIDLTKAAVMTEQELEFLNLKREIVKRSLWAMSNIAAMYNSINNNQIQRDQEDEFFFKDGSMDQILAVTEQALQNHYHEIYYEGMFCIVILVTTCTERQMAQYMCTKQIVDLCLQVLKEK